MNNSIENKQRPEVVSRAEMGDLRGQMLETTRHPLLALDAELHVCYANPAFYELFPGREEDTLGRGLFELGEGQWDIPELRRLLSQTLTQEKSIEDYRVEHEFETLGRKVFLIDAREIAVAENDGQRILLAIDDVTEREEAQEEVVARKEFAEKLIDSLREAVLVLTPELKVVEANDAFYDMFKVTPEETLDRYIYDLGNGQWDIPGLRRLLGEIIPQQRSFDNYEIEHEFEDIGWRLMSLNARRLDHLPRVLLTIYDLTEERESRRQLEHNEQRFRGLLESAAQAVWETNGDGEFESEAPTWCELTGQSPEECEGSGWLNAIHPQDRERVDREWQQARERGAPLNTEFRIRTGGTWCWTNLHAAPLHDEDGRIFKWVGMNLDITRRKAAEHALRESEQRFRTMADGVPLIIWVHDAQGRQQMVNSTFLEFFGFHEGEELNDSWKSLIHPDDREAYVHAFFAALEQQGPFHSEVRVRRHDGRWRYLESWGRPRFSADGTFLGMVGTSVDVTERKRAERELHKIRAELEQRVQERSAQLVAERNFKETILNTVTALIVIVDRTNTIVGFNRACERLTGYAAEDVVASKTPLDLMPQAEHTMMNELFAKLWNGEEHLIHHEGHWIGRDGESSLISWSNTVLQDSNGNIEYVICTGIDVTHERQAQEEARQHLEAASTLQRLQTAHELATMLAHELNQPLGAIANYAATGMRMLGQIDTPPQSAGLENLLKRISDQSLRAGQTIRSLREFVDRGRIEPEPVNLMFPIRNAVSLIYPRARRAGIELKIYGRDNLPTVMAVEIQIEQVLLNLLRNAIEAIEETDMASGLITVQLTGGQEVLRVSVIDNGPGLDPKTVGALFEPLSSTKTQGLGVGLSISRSLIEAHEGRIWVESRSPGAIFHFELPISHE